MSSKALTKPEDDTKGQLPATTAAGSMPAFIAGKMAQDAGKGVSTAAEDNLVPLLRVLQSNSPQVDKRSPDYVEGANPGDLWLRNSGLPAVDGEEGLLFQHCYFTIDYVEWVPRDDGGGFVARHPDLPPEAKEVEDPKDPNKTKLVMPNGNELTHTRYHIGNIYTDNGVMPFVIPFSSSGHTVSRQWMSLMNGKESEGVKAVAWACLYRLRTKQRSNKKGTWFVISATDAGWIWTGVPEEVANARYERGSKLYDSFAAGEKVIETPEAEDVATGEGEQHSDTSEM